MLRLSSARAVCCVGAPPPPPPLYDVLGSIAVGTLENSLFLWDNQMYVLENMICNDPNHAGHWDPRFDGACVVPTGLGNDPGMILFRGIAVVS